MVRHQAPAQKLQPSLQTVLCHEREVQAPVFIAENRLAEVALLSDVKGVPGMTMPAAVGT
jgi:hypothetical protein